MQLRKESLKKIQAFTGFDHSNPWPLLYRCSALPIKLTSQLGAGRTSRAFFSQPLSCLPNCDDLPSNNSSLRRAHIWFSYIHNFVIILSRVFHEPIQRPAPGWLVSLIGRALQRYRRGQGFESLTSLNFFQAFFSKLHKLRIQMRLSPLK